MLATATLALAFLQQPKHSFHFVPKPEESWTYDAKISANLGSEMKGTAKFAFTASHVANDGSWTNRMQMREVEVTVDDQVQNSEDGNEMTIERDAFGVVQDWAKYEPRDDIGFDAAELLLGYTPLAAVSVGESWKGRVPGGSQLEPFAFKFEGEEKVKERTLLKLSLTGTAPTAGDLTGTVWLSPQRYQVVKFVIASKPIAGESSEKFSLRFDLVQK